MHILSLRYIKISSRPFEIAKHQKSVDRFGILFGVFAATTNAKRHTDKQHNGGHKVWMK